MRLNVKFKESKQSFNPAFGEVNNISDGGYERGYQAGYDQGYADGFAEGETKGKADGYNQGYDVGLADGKNQGYTKGYEAGYQAGYAKGKEDGYAEGHSAGFAEGEKVGYSNGYTEGETKGKEQGYTEGYNEGMIPSYYIGEANALYYNAVFPENSELILRIKELRNASLDQLINKAKNLKKFTLVIESSTVDSVSVAQFVRENTDTEIIDFTNINLKIKDVRYFALSATKLKSIVGALDFSPCTNATIWLNGAYALEDIEFVPNTIKISIDFYWCTKLSKASLTSIINGLSADTSANTVTLSKTAVNNAFGGTDSAEWLALVATKPNWTISLS